MHEEKRQVRSGAKLDRERSGRSVAPSPRVLRPTIAGWQLPYLRVALILRHLRTTSRRDRHGRGELANVVRVHAAVRRAGWFN
jgi:hypothetical protein